MIGEPDKVAVNWVLRIVHLERSLASKIARAVLVEEAKLLGFTHGLSTDFSTELFTTNENPL